MESVVDGWVRGMERVGRMSGRGLWRLHMMFAVASVISAVTVSNSTVLLTDSKTEHGASTQTHPLGPPDAMLLRTPEQLFHAQSMLSRAVPKQYSLFLAYDTLPFPLAYSTWLGVLLLTLCKRTHRNPSKTLLGPLLPALTLLFDIIENALLTLSYLLLPNPPHPFLAWTSCAFTILKFTSLITSFIALCTLLISAAAAATPQQRKPIPSDRHDD